MSKKDEMNLKITQEQINGFLNNLNHRMTKIETDVCWIKRILWFLVGIGGVNLLRNIFMGG